MASKKIESVLAMSKLYNCKPSDILHIEDSYTAFCFDEASAYIRMKLDAGEKPTYYSEKEVEEYSNFKDFYKNFGG